MFSFPLRAAFALSALLMLCDVAGAQDAPNPQIAALLPPAREVNGLQLRITDAGFAVPTELGIDKRRADQSVVFFFSHQLLPKVAKPSGVDDDARLNFIGLFAPDGAPLTATGKVGPLHLFSDVSPRWKSVRAEFEVRNPRFPEAATGRYVTHHEFKNIALPPLLTDERQSATIAGAPSIGFVTPHGTRVQLSKISRTKYRDASYVEAIWKVTRLVPDAKLEFENIRVSLINDQTREEQKISSEQFFSPLFVEPEFPMNIYRIPDAMTSLSFAFDFVESARVWRAQGAFDKVSIEIPVAALWKAAPVAPRLPATPPLRVRNDEFEASWETLGISRQPGFPSLWTRLWLRDLKPSFDGAHWTVREATREAKDFDASANSPGEQSVLRPLRWNSFFHADNRPDNSSQPNPINVLEGSPYWIQSANITVSAQRARTLSTSHFLKDVPLPKPDETLNFARGQFFDGAWHLRRIISVQSAALAERINAREDDLILVFDVDSKQALFDKPELVSETVIYDEKGWVEANRGTLMRGDPLEKGREKDRVSLVLLRPEAGTKRLSVKFRARQRLWLGEPKKVVLPTVPLGANFEEVGAKAQ